MPYNSRMYLKKLRMPSPTIQQPYATAVRSCPAATVVAGQNPANSISDEHDTEGWSTMESRRTRTRRVRYAQTQNNAAHDQPHRRIVTSRYTRPTLQSSASANVLTGVEYTKKKIFYVGNISPQCEAKSIATWCSERGVNIISCSVSSSPYFGTAYARVVVPESDEETVGKPEFWPATLAHTVRPWYWATDEQYDQTVHKMRPKRTSESPSSQVCSNDGNVSK